VPPRPSKKTREARGVVHQIRRLARAAVHRSRRPGYPLGLFIKFNSLPSHHSPHTIHLTPFTSAPLPRAEGNDITRRLRLPSPRPSRRGPPPPAPPCTRPRRSAVGDPPRVFRGISARRALHDSRDDEVSGALRGGHREREPRRDERVHGDTVTVVSETISHGLGFSRPTIGFHRRRGRVAARLRSRSG
jgi:hypothetical protein